MLTHLRRFCSTSMETSRHFRDQQKTRRKRRWSPDGFPKFPAQRAPSHLTSSLSEWLSITLSWYSNTASILWNASWISYEESYIRSKLCVDFKILEMRTLIHSLVPLFSNTLFRIWRYSHAHKFCRTVFIEKRPAWCVHGRQRAFLRRRPNWICTTCTLQKYSPVATVDNSQTWKYQKF